MAFPEDIEQLDQLLRRLQVEWEKYFAGTERKPPTDLKAKVETLIRRWAYEEIRNNAERFRYQTLTARYNTFSELWNKRLRAREEGKAFGVHGLKADALPPPPTAKEEPRHGQRPTTRPGEVRVSDPSRDVDAVRRLYQSFVAARERAGEPGGVKFESFQKLIGQQATRILSERGGEAVDFRLETLDGKVSLKARVVK